MRRFAWTVVVWVCLGCDPGSMGGDDAGPVVGTDAGRRADGGSSSDGGGGDAGPGDAGVVDAGDSPADAGGGRTGPIRVMVLGSSTAEGKNLDQPMYGGRAGGLADRYSVLYEAHLDGRFPGSMVTNVALAGASTFIALPSGTSTSVPSGLDGPDPMRNVDYAIAWGADAIIVNFPSPRAAAGEPTDVWVANHREIIDAAAAAGIEGWVALPNPAWLPADVPLAQANRDALLAEFGAARTLDFYAAIEGASGTHDPMYALTDGSHHPNAAGNLRFLDVLIATDLPMQLDWME
ncbi:MAG: hypothetical protein AB7S26_08400 [Sandaracinaceae bacterium]